jgi:hypothetical protein
MKVKMAWRCCKAYTCDNGGAYCTWDMTLSHVTKVEKIEMRLGSTDRLQVWRASWRLWSEGLRVMVKLEQDLAPMDQRNGEEQVRSRSMNQYGHVMIWSESYHLVISWYMCCINIEGDGMECARKRYNLENFHITGHRCVEMLMIGFRIDGRTIKRGKLVCILII